MPVVVAFFVRQLIIIGVQLGIFAVAERVLVPLLNSAISQIASFFGVDQDDAADILANEVITTIEALGLTVAFSRAKLPLVVSEKLGFTSKGFRRRSLKPKAKEKLQKTDAGRQVVKNSGGVSAGKLTLGILGASVVWNLLTDWVWIGGSLSFLPENAQSDIRSRAINITKTLQSAQSIVFSAEKDHRSLTKLEVELVAESAQVAEDQVKDMRKAFGSRFVLFGKTDVLLEFEATAANINAQIANLRQIAGIKKGTKPLEAKISAVVSEVIDGDTVVLDNGEFVRLVGIDAPEKTTKEGQISKAYLRTLVEKKRVEVESDPFALTDIYDRRLAVLTLGGENINIEMLRAGQAKFFQFERNSLVNKKTWTAAASGGGGATGGGTSQQFRALTGVVGSGTLGPAVKAEERGLEFIETDEELRTQARKALLGFLRSIPGRIIFEIKLVTSYIDEKGIRQRAEPQTRVIGTNEDGSPKEKRLLNRIAVIDVYALKNPGERTKIDRIVLGPTDAFGLTTGVTELAALESTLRAGVGVLPSGETSATEVPAVKETIPEEESAFNLSEVEQKDTIEVETFSGGLVQVRDKTKPPGVVLDYDGVGLLNSWQAISLEGGPGKFGANVLGAVDSFNTRQIRGVKVDPGRRAITTEELRRLLSPFGGVVSLAAANALAAAHQPGGLAFTEKI